jgi:hypothetical protein
VCMRAGRPRRTHLADPAGHERRPRQRSAPSCSRTGESPPSAASRPPDGGRVEIFDPEDPTARFQLGPNMKHFRGYHSAAILLPDGRVIVGGDPNGGATPNERYLPSYFFKPRPTITAAPATLITAPDSRCKHPPPVPSPRSSSCALARSPTASTATSATSAAPSPARPETRST